MTSGIVTAQRFVTKRAQAFRWRGPGDSLASRNLEDVVAVVDGRPELLEEVAGASAELRSYLADEVGAWLDGHLHEDVIPCHLLPGDAASQPRSGLVLARLARIAGLAPT